MVVVEDKEGPTSPNNVKPETSSLLLDSGSRLPAAPASSNTTTTTIRCPECGSQRVWKDGMRYTLFCEVQRYICRECSYRFSNSSNSAEPSEHHQKLHTLILKSKADKTILCQIGAAQLKGAKNLATVETRIQEKAAGATTKTLDEATIKGLIIQYMAWLEKEGYYHESCYATRIKRLVRLGANLLDPENVKQVIATTEWKDSGKMLATYAYDIMVTKILKTQWSPPKYKQKQSLPFVPDEKELDQLIAACTSRRLATFLQTLKETYADPGEILNLEWKDLSGNIITINAPVKGHDAGQVQISNRLVAMLNSLPKTSTRIFPTTYDSMYMIFWQLRKRLAHRLQNPRFLYISFKSFRHWGGSMIAHYTNGNVLTVKKMLRHKSILNSMKYIHMLNLKDDEFDVATATTVEEIKQLAEAGFQKFDEINNIHIFRRPKRFSNI
jgi:integrase